MFSNATGCVLYLLLSLRPSMNITVLNGIFQHRFVEQSHRIYSNQRENTGARLVRYARTDLI